MDRKRGRTTVFEAKMYRMMMERVLSKRSRKRAVCQAEAEAALAEVNDPVERMLVSQMLWMQARLAFLNFYSTHQKDHRWLELMSSSCDRLTETFRRHAMALAEWRDPKRKRFVAVKQANFAGQQIVGDVMVNDEIRKAKLQ